MRKTVCLLLALVVVLFACGCSEMDEKAEIVKKSVAVEEVLNEEDIKTDEKTEETVFSDEEPDREEPAEITQEVYRTKTGEKYHVEGCYHLKSKIKTTLEEAKDMGLKPCTRCNPPQ